MSWVSPRSTFFFQTGLKEKNEKQVCNKEQLLFQPSKSGSNVNIDPQTTTRPPLGGGGGGGGRGAKGLGGVTEGGMLGNLTYPSILATFLPEHEFLNVQGAQDSIPPAYVACRAGTTTLFLLGY